MASWFEATSLFLFDFMKRYHQPAVMMVFCQSKRNVSNAADQSGMSIRRMTVTHVNVIEFFDLQSQCCYAQALFRPSVSPGAEQKRLEKAMLRNWLPNKNRARVEALRYARLAYFSHVFSLLRNVPTRWNLLRSLLLNEGGSVYKHSYTRAHSLIVHSCYSMEIIDVRLTELLTTSLRAGSTWDRALCCCRSCVSNSWNLLILTITEGTVDVKESLVFKAYRSRNNLGRMQNTLK